AVSALARAQSNVAPHTRPASRKISRKNFCCELNGKLARDARERQAAYVQRIEGLASSGSRRQTPACVPRFLRSVFRLSEPTVARACPVEKTVRAVQVLLNHIAAQAQGVRLHGALRCQSGFDAQTAPRCVFEQIGLLCIRVAPALFFEAVNDGE